MSNGLPWVPFKALEVFHKGTCRLLGGLKMSSQRSKGRWLYFNDKGEEDRVKGKRSSIIYLQMILLLFRRLSKIKWCNYVGCSYNLKLAGAGSELRESELILTGRV